MSESSTDARERHPDDATVAEARDWLDGLADETSVQFKVHKLRGVLNVLDGWKRSALSAAAQRNAAEGELANVRAQLRTETAIAKELLQDVVGLGTRACRVEAERDDARAELAKMRELIAAEVEAHAEAIGWYEGGGVWAEAIDVIKQEPWTRRDVDA